MNDVKGYEVPEMSEAEARKLVYKRAVNQYGQMLQLVVAVEELSELQKELCKFIRGEGDLNNLLEEVADVRIIIEQIQMYFHLETAVDPVIRRKMERLIYRLDKEEKNA